jgi:thioredoxin-related protein
MKKLFGLLVIVLGLSTLSSNAQTWTTDYQAALKESKKTNKAILMNFTGSDWCGWCIRLKNEVFSKEEFIAYANENLILLELDFPKRKQINADLKTQNINLARKHGVRGYPTIIMIDGNEKILFRGGYKAGGPVPYVALLKKAIAGPTAN